MKSASGLPTEIRPRPKTVPISWP